MFSSCCRRTKNISQSSVLYMGIRSELQVFLSLIRTGAHIQAQRGARIPLKHDMHMPGIIYSLSMFLHARFSKVAKLKSVFSLDIRGRILTNKLSPRTKYAAYLVFQLGQSFCGVEAADSVVRFVDQEADEDAEKRATILSLYPSREQIRSGGWLKVEMGRFKIDRGDVGEVEARLMKFRGIDEMSGLIVEGLEFRPVTNSCSVPNRRTRARPARVKARR